MSSAAASSGKATDGQLEERLDLTRETTEKIAQATALLRESSPAAAALSRAAATATRSPWEHASTNALPADVPEPGKESA